MIFIVFFNIYIYNIYIKSALTPFHRTFPPYTHRLIFTPGGSAGSDDRSHQWSGLGRLQRSAPAVPWMLLQPGQRCHVRQWEESVFGSSRCTDFVFILLIKSKKTNPHDHSLFAYCRCFLFPANKNDMFIVRVLLFHLWYGELADRTFDRDCRSFSMFTIPTWWASTSYK